MGNYHAAFWRAVEGVTPSLTLIARCHHVHPEEPKKSYRRGEKYKCGNCGWKHNADISAGIVISQLGAAVINPESSVMSCQLEGQLNLLPIGLH
jgi:putative transposase